MLKDELWRDEVMPKLKASVTGNWTQYDDVDLFVILGMVRKHQEAGTPISDTVMFELKLDTINAHFYRVSFLRHENGSVTLLTCNVEAKPSEI